MGRHLLCPIIKAEAQLPTTWLINSQKELKQCALASTRNTCHSNKIAFSDADIHLFQHRLPVFSIGEAQITHLYCRKIFVKFSSVCTNTILLFRKIQDLFQSLRETDGSIDLTGYSCGTCDRLLNLPHQLDDRRQHSVCQISPVNAKAAPEHTKQPPKLENQIDTVVHIHRKSALSHLCFLKMLLPYIHLVLYPLFRATRLDQSQILQSFLQHRMQLSFFFLYFFMPLLHGFPEQDQ